MTDHILETRKLTKEFRGFMAVDAVDLRVQRGHIHALIGPNGAGKTTCFNLLTRFVAPSSGRWPIVFMSWNTAASSAPSRPHNCKPACRH